MKKKNFKALEDFSNIITNKNLKEGIFHCASGEILGYTSFQIVCTEKVSVDDMENLKKSRFVNGENLPNFVKDFNVKKTIEDYNLEENKTTIELKQLEEKIKQVKKMFHARRKSYVGNTPVFVLDGSLTELRMNDALIESYRMKNGTTVYFNTEILFDVAKIICNKEAEIYFAGRNKPIYIIGEYGTGMFLPVYYKDINLDGFLVRYNIKTVFN